MRNRKKMDVIKDFLVEKGFKEEFDVIYVRDDDEETYEVTYLGEGIYYLRIDDCMGIYRNYFDATTLCDELRRYLG